MIKTWQALVGDIASTTYQGYVTKEEIDACKQAEIDELRAALKARDAAYMDGYEGGKQEARDAAHDELDELRAEIARLNSGWYDKLLKATLERDALQENYTLLGEVCDQMISGAVNMLDIARDADRLAAENAEQRKVLEQALGALEYIKTRIEDGWNTTTQDRLREAAITAIQGVLNAG